jgi:phosphoribosylformylglycinamidine (FGAM) synthase-like amidotransferase family enzyme
MHFSFEKFESRREFFRSAGRYGVATALAAFATVAAWKKPGTGQPCINLGICNGCQVFSRCELPSAQSARRNQSGG